LNFEQLIHQRRSVRDFLDKPIPQALILDMIRDSCRAPSAANHQPWQFIVVPDKKTIKALSDEAKRNVVEGIKRQPGSPVNAFLDQLQQPDFNVFHNASALVYIAGNPKIASIAFDVSLAAAYFMFSATSRGLGTCWIGLGKEIMDPELLAAIGLPEGLNPVWQGELPQSPQQRLLPMR
jgi:nitroreductase